MWNPTIPESRVSVLKGLGISNLDRFANLAPAESAAEKVLSNL